MSISVHRCLCVQKNVFYFTFSIVVVDCCHVYILGLNDFFFHFSGNINNCFFICLFIPLKTLCDPLEGLIFVVFIIHIMIVNI